MQLSMSQHRQNSSVIAKRRRFVKVNQDIETWKRSSKIKTSPSATIGRSERNSAEKKDGPGPGAYDLHKMPFQDKQMISFKGSKLVRCQTESPGPGSYHPPSVFSSKKFSFPRSKLSILNQIRPEPTSYNIPSGSQAQGITFPKKQRDSLNDKSKQSMPGPGKYQWKGEKISKNEYSFSKTKKFAEEEIELSEKQVIPGPGAYQTSKGRHKMQSYKFSQALKNLISREKTPGPGSYTCETTTLVHNGGSISKEKRDFNYSNNIPGPGNYREVSVESVKNREPRVTFSRSNTQNVKTQFEGGPGAYYRDKGGKIMGGVIGRQKRGSVQNSITPGPLNYTPHFDQVLTKSAHVAFGKQQRTRNAHPDTPGPGYYNINGKSHSLASSQARHNATEMRRPSEHDRLHNGTSMSHN